MASCKVAIATNSLGKSVAGHDIHRKLEAAKRHGFDGVEVAIECIDAHARLFEKQQQSREDRMCAAAQDIYNKTSALGLRIIALNPFGAYDALVHPSDVESRLQEAQLWCQLCEIMRCAIFQVC